MSATLAIFDLDGTLIDSLGDIGDAVNVVLAKLGHPTHPRDSYRCLVGDGLDVLVRRALPAGSIEEKDIPELVGLVRQEYSTRWTATTRPYPDIPELLASLRSRGIESAVLSNKPDFATRGIVDELFEDHVFAVVRGALDGVPLKPDPSSALDIVSELGRTPQQSIFVGDTPVDVATGTNAEMQSVGVTWGFREAKELVNAGADYIIGTPLELLDLLD